MAAVFSDLNKPLHHMLQSSLQRPSRMVLQAVLQFLQEEGFLKGKTIMAFSKLY